MVDFVPLSILKALIPTASVHHFQKQNLGQIEACAVCSCLGGSDREALRVLWSVSQGRHLKMK